MTKVLPFRAFGTAPSRPGRGIVKPRLTLSCFDPEATATEEEEDEEDEAEAEAAADDEE